MDGMYDLYSLYYPKSIGVIMTAGEHYCFGCRRHLKIENFSAVELAKVRIKQRCDRCLARFNKPRKAIIEAVKPYCVDHINFIQGHIDG